MNVPDPTTLLAELVRIDSRTPGSLATPLAADAVTEEGIAAFVAARLRDFGFACRLQEAAPRRPNLIAWNVRDPARPTLAFQAHFDTVGSDGMTHAPLVPELRNGRLYGRGAADTKGSLAAMLVALARLQASGTGPNLMFLGTCAEETGCEGVRHLDLREFRIDGIVAGEPTANRLIVGHKSHAWFGIECRGRAAHGSCPEAGDNAIYRMLEVVARLRTIADGDLREESQPGFTPCTLSVDCIRGGTKVNIIPERCEIEVDMRLVPRLPADETLAALLDTVRQGMPPDRVRLSWSHLAPGLHVPATHPLVQTMLAALRARGLPADTGTVNYCTDAGVLAQMGHPAVVFGPGSILQAHGAEEYIELAQLEQAVDVLVTAANAFPVAP